MFKVGQKAEEASKDFVRDNLRALMDAVNDVIKRTERTSEVNSLTDPAFFKQRKEPIENVHSSFLEHWDDIKGKDKAFFVFINSLKNGIKTVKRPRPEPVKGDEETKTASSGKVSKKRARKKSNGFRSPGRVQPCRGNVIDNNCRPLWSYRKHDARDI